ncbi:MAG: DUF1501 domain-containing protein, partial [Planctomycetaceae bacterium]
MTPDCPPETRRGVMARIARSLFGVTAADALLAGAAHGAAAGAPAGPARAIVTLFMRGAMSHLDTFDPKPG